MHSDVGTATPAQKSRCVGRSSATVVSTRSLESGGVQLAITFWTSASPIARVASRSCGLVAKKAASCAIEHGSQEFDLIHFAAGHDHWRRDVLEDERTVNSRLHALHIPRDDIDGFASPGGGARCPMDTPPAPDGPCPDGWRGVGRSTRWPARSVRFPRKSPGMRRCGDLWRLRPSTFNLRDQQSRRCRNTTATLPTRSRMARPCW